MCVLSAAVMTGCYDDTFDNFGVIGEGDADLRATVEFEKLTPALDSRAAGDAVGPVSNLQMIIYKVENDETTFFKRVVCNELDGYNLTTHEKPVEPGDVETGSSQTANGQFGPTGELTDHADFTYSFLPYGLYKIYAVANVPGLTDDDCVTEDNLRSLSFNWNASDISANNAMFGYFTLGDHQSSNGFDAPVITVNSRRLEIHAWIKRLVSKVTVAFDPSELKESVTVYIKNVTIHDIPESCYLGKDNSPKVNDLISDGEQIKYYDEGNEKDYAKWMILQKGSGKKGSSHSNTDNALFFFENMQGDYEGQKPYLKVQIPDETGTSIDEPGNNQYAKDPNDPKENDFKDRVKAGTYIEVEAYYVSKNTEKMSSGNIKYRFMLGKNITYNYNAQRNHHYKLTLKLRGFANEADWHISYVEPTPSLYTPDKFYVSYLYGQRSDFPVRIITGDAVNTSRYTLKAEIIENPWWPYDEVTGGYPAIRVGSADNFEGFAWMKSAVEYNVEEGVLSTPYYVGNNKNFAGFLSLRQPEIQNDKYADIEFPDVKETDGYAYGPLHNDALRNYYNNNNVAYAAYTLENGTRNVGLYDESKNVFTTGSEAQGQYTVTRDVDESVTLKIPMYTRPKKLVAASDFTGNNPYGSYMRRAIVRFTLWDEKGKKVEFKDLADNDKSVDHRDVPIFQVRRVENPKAIYRAYNNTDPFEIKLMHLRDVNASTPASEFTTFESDGPWRASILTCTDDFVQLEKDGQKVTEMGQYIYGSTGDSIVFTYRPKSECDVNSARCALILVEYHDYTCNHIIFVRQGYDDKMTLLAETYWTCYQVYATGKETTSNVPEDIPSCDVVVTQNPLSMGSLLKRCQYNFSFRDGGGNPGWLKKVLTEVKNDKGETTDWADQESLSVTFINKDNVADTKNVTWGGVQAYGWWNYNGSEERYSKAWADTWTTVQHKAGKELTVPTYKQFEDLRDNCDFGFGIAYADGATKTAVKISEAYGYIDADNTNVKNSYGTRACVAYDSHTGWNILFPLGSTGNGRRAAGGAYNYSSAPATLGLPNPGAGTLSYSGMSTVLYTTRTTYRPIIYNHYREPGAVYWIKQPYYVAGDKTKSYPAWDINYFTLLFNKHDSGSLGNFSKNTVNNNTVSDALPIKLVYKKEE